MEEKHPTTSKKSPGQKLFNYGRYSSLAFQLVAVILLGTWGGLNLDRFFHSRFPFFTFGLSLLAVIGALYITLRDMTKK